MSKEQHIVQEFLHDLKEKLNDPLINNRMSKEQKIVFDLLTELGATIKETNKILKFIVVNQSPVIVSAISESEAAARAWDIDGKTIEEIHAELPPKEDFETFKKRMQEHDNY